jgi:hypothetical protein
MKIDTVASRNLPKRKNGNVKKTINPKDIPAQNFWAPASKFTRIDFE